MNADSTISVSLLEAAERIYHEAESDEAALEAELLMCQVLDVDLTELYQRMREPIGEAVVVFSSYVDRRCAREPTAYIVGHREFYGLKFEVTPAVLIPRPETEILVDALLEFAGERYAFFTMADIGVGCGSIAIAVTWGNPPSNVSIVAIDDSPDAIEVAVRNARTHGQDKYIQFRHGDLLAPLTEPVDIIAANLPYVTTADWETLPPEIRDWEPRTALDGGPDGLRVIERLVRDAPGYLNAGGGMFVEIGDEQGPAARAIAEEAFPAGEITITHDLAGKARVLEVRLS